MCYIGIDMEDMDSYSGKRTVTRKQIKELEDAYKKEYSEEEVSKIMKICIDTLKIDPNKSSYNQQAGLKQMERRKERAKNAGVTLYIAAGVKKSYEKKKAEQICI